MPIPKHTGMRSRTRALPAMPNECCTGETQSQVGQSSLSITPRSRLSHCFPQWEQSQYQTFIIIYMQVTLLNNLFHPKVNHHHTFCFSLPSGIKGSLQILFPELVPTDHSDENFCVHSEKSRSCSLVSSFRTRSK